MPQDLTRRMLARLPDEEVRMTWGGLDEIFNPGAGHFREEMERKRVEARIPGKDADPHGAGSVDLDKGVVRITRPMPQDAVDPQDSADEDQ